jgi:hypothetical protein
MKEWLKTLISDDNTVSSKRVLSILSFMVMLVLTIIYMFNPVLISFNHFLVYASIAFGQSLLSKINMKK